MNEKFQASRWSARNPLGIIALFISLIYGMSALLLGASVGNLETFNQTILVLFIVVFPFVVLGVFAWFVAKHHKKLYGPGDFRSDEAFHAADDLPPAALGRRLAEEIEAAEAEKKEEVNSETILEHEENVQTSKPKPTPTESQQSTEPVRRTGLQPMVARAYVAEGLVFQELQRELGGAVKREVTVPLRDGRQFRADGIIQVENDITIVEVKLIRNHRALINRLKQIIHQLRWYLAAITDNDITKIKLILAIVLDGDVSLDVANRIINRRLSEFGEMIEIRVFSLRELLQKYGLPDDNEDVEVIAPAESSSTAKVYIQRDS